MSPRFLRAGTDGVLVEFAGLAEAVACRDAFEAAPIAGVTDAAAGARTLLLTFDPAATDRHAVEAAVRALPPRPAGAAPPRLVEIPVVYDGEDLEAAAAAVGLSTAALIAVHTGRTWVSAFCGFAPGFSYLAGEGPALSMPRRATPRTRVPAGAVALAGEFSAVYPRSSPGGWQLIGRTELPMWVLERDPAATLPVGTRVRFVDADRA